MTALHKTLIPAITAALIGGCATGPQQCDPRYENFFNNTSCLASGSYDQRRQNLERTLHQERQRNRAFRDMLSDLRAQREQLARSRYAREQDYRRLDGSWERLQRDLAPLIAENRRLERRIAQINRDLAENRSLASSGDTTRKTELIEDLQHEVLLLQQELDAGVY
jgi:chromosome segregation ATPase